jgi:hypothetical protein
LGGNEFAPVGCHFDGGLFLRVPVYRHLVHEVQDTSDGATCNNVMVQVCILIVSQ